MNVLTGSLCRGRLCVWRRSRRVPTPRRKHRGSGSSTSTSLERNGDGHGHGMGMATMPMTLACSVCDAQRDGCRRAGDAGAVQGAMGFGVGLTGNQQHLHQSDGRGHAFRQRVPDVAATSWSDDARWPISDAGHRLRPARAAYDPGHPEVNRRQRLPRNCAATRISRADWRLAISIAPLESPLNHKAYYNRQSRYFPQTAR